MANSPRTTTMRSMPFASQLWSKVYLLEYLTGSRPTVFRKSPKQANMPAARIFPRWAMMTRTSPRSAARKISLEPKRGATLARIGAIRIRHMTENIPPKKDAA